VSIAEQYLHSEEDEFVLACLLTSATGKAHLAAALEQVAPDDFYDPHLGELWRAGQAITTAGERISKRALLARHDTPAARSRVEAIAGQPVFGSKVPGAIAAVVEHAHLRRLVQAAERIVEMTTTSASYSEALELASAELGKLQCASVSSEVLSWDQVAEAWWQPESAGTVVHTPWPEVDDYLSGGMRSGRSYVVAGRPGAGKSIVGLNLASAAAERGHPVLVFSAEMGHREIAGRIMASGARAEYGGIVRGDIGPDDHARIREYHDRTRAMPLSIVDRANISVEFIAATARTHKRTRGLDVLVVDYLQLLEASDKRMVREQQVSHISRSLKMLSRELDCVVVVACQLNRGSARENRKPTLAELRESGSIEQDADVVLLLHHELVDDRPSGEVEVLIAKNRTGKTGEVILPWRAHQARVG
jgi:replicative DNA helicase